MPSRVEATRQELTATLENMESQRIKAEELRFQEHGLKNPTESSVKESELRINSLERSIAMLENRLTYDSRVVSNSSGMRSPA